MLIIMACMKNIQILLNKLRQKGEQHAVKNGYIYLPIAKNTYACILYNIFSGFLGVCADITCFKIPLYMCIYVNKQSKHPFPSCRHLLPVYRNVECSGAAIH